jgi:hypothetical protein
MVSETTCVFGHLLDTCARHAAEGWDVPNQDDKDLDDMGSFLRQKDKQVNKLVRQ